MRVGLTRRQVMEIGFCLASGTVGSGPARAFGAPRALRFDNLHTGEKLAVEYWANGAYLPQGLRQIEQNLRDHRTGEAHAIEPRLLDLLYRLRTVLETSEPFQVISGYRSPATNAMLASLGDGVARNSLHTLGLAIDIRVPGRALQTVRDAALALRGGGVGFYPRSDFVHVDVGRVRRW